MNCPIPKMLRLTSFLDEFRPDHVRAEAFLGIPFSLRQKEKILQQKYSPAIVDEALRLKGWALSLPL